MNAIKNIHLLNLPDKAKHKIEVGAKLHRKMSNIIFKVLEVNDESVSIRAMQNKCLSANYLDKKTLVIRTKELFEPFLLGKKVHARVIPFVPSPPNQVDSSWLQQEMKRSNIGIDEIVKDTGIDRLNVLKHVNGSITFRQPMKALVASK